MTTLRDQLRRQERCILFPYLDSVRNEEHPNGIWTIGWGHNIESDPEMMPHLEELKKTGITQIEADLMLDDDISNHTAALVSMFPWVPGLDWPREAAMINLTFNMGLKRLSSFHHFLDAMQNERWTEAKNRLLYGQATVPTDGHITPYYREVHGRAMEMAKQIESGVMA